MTPNPYKSPIQLHILSTRHPHSFAGSGFSKEGSRMNLPNKYPHHPSEQVPPNSCEIGAPSDLNPQTPIPDTSHKTPSKEIRCPPTPPSHTHGSPQALQSGRTLPPSPSSLAPRPTPAGPGSAAPDQEDPLDHLEKKFPQVPVPQPPRAGPTSGATPVTPSPGKPSWTPRGHLRWPSAATAHPKPSAPPAPRPRSRGCPAPRLGRPRPGLRAARPQSDLGPVLALPLRLSFPLSTTRVTLGGRIHWGSACKAPGLARCGRSRTAAIFIIN